MMPPPERALADGVIVAVDDARLAAEVASFGGRAVLTSPACPSGTDRIAEVAAGMPEIDVFVNVQGDEPEINPAAIDLVASTLMANPHADIATVATPIRRPEVLSDPSCVKIVLGERFGAGQGGHVIYFSRAVVPHARDGITTALLQSEPPLYWHHIGLYAYRRDFLSWFAGQPPSPLEQTERLEQLRAIEAGKRIVVARIESATPGIDTAEDFQAFAERVGGHSTK